ncbi:MAG: hypothetical protein ACFE9Z_00980 [Promethearchaeota archaeon]
MTNFKNRNHKISIERKTDNQKATEILDIIAAFYHFILMILSAIIILNNIIFKIMNIVSATLFLFSFFYLLIRNNPFQIYVIYSTIFCVIFVIIGIFDPYRGYVVPLPTSDIFLISFTGISLLPWAIYIILTFKFSGTNNIAKHVFYSSYGPQGYGKKRLDRFWQVNPEKDPEYKQKILQVRRQYHKRKIILFVISNTIFFIATDLIDYLIF